ncbi:hypothetical protein M378DRAFT_88465, partial [Amanita muscaria Koide BX008]
RTLVLCFDGTGDQFDNDNSNIVQLVSMLKKDDKTKQMVYYQYGLPYVYVNTFIVCPCSATVPSHRAAIAVMTSLHLHFLDIGGGSVENGTRQSLARIPLRWMVRECFKAKTGILFDAASLYTIGLDPAVLYPYVLERPPLSDSLIAQARERVIQTPESTSRPKWFKSWFKGVARTQLRTGHVGLNKHLHRIKTFRHAVSLDEHRSKFKANLWNRPNDQEKDLGIDNRATLFRLSTQDDHTQDRLEMLYTDKNDTLTDVEEVWFAVCIFHLFFLDIGGGSVENGTRQSLARIPLRWMVRECFKAKTGIIFDTASLYTIGLDPAVLYPHVLERPPLSDSLIAQARERVIQTPESISWSQWFKSWFTGVAPEQNAAPIVPFDSEDNEDLRDALSPKYDQLKLSRFWWILEILPVSMRYQRGDNQWVSYIGINMGKARFIPKQHSGGVKVHRSVKLRMEAQHKDGSKYQPQANLAVVPTWI